MLEGAQMEALEGALPTGAKVRAPARTKRRLATLSVFQNRARELAPECKRGSVPSCSSLGGSEHGTLTHFLPRTQLKSQCVPNCSE